MFLSHSHILPSINEEGISNFYLIFSKLDNVPLTKCLLFTLQSMQISSPPFLQYMLQATELLYIQRLQSNQFVPCQ